MWTPSSDRKTVRLALAAASSGRHGCAHPRLHVTAASALAYGQVRELAEPAVSDTQKVTQQPPNTRK
jgi:hypothetical protein